MAVERALGELAVLEQIRDRRAFGAIRTADQRKVDGDTVAARDELRERRERTHAQHPDRIARLRLQVRCGEILDRARTHQRISLIHISEPTRLLSISYAV